MSRRPYVFVIDDDEGMCRALNRLLNSANIETAVFHLGADALHEMNRRKPDCVVLDVELPDFNSLKLFERISSAFPRLPVVIITAWEDEDVRNKAIQQGAIGVFYKPFTEDVLLSAIATAVAQSEASDEDPPTFELGR